MMEKHKYTVSLLIELISALVSTYHHYMEFSGFTDRGQGAPIGLHTTSLRNMFFLGVLRTMPQGRNPLGKMVRD